MQIKKILPRVKAQLGFTMIELLVVISILGILAVAVLSAINPIEQINRGRDTGTRSDAEQLISAVDRYYAYKGYYPWVNSAVDEDAIASLTAVNNTDWVDNGDTTVCPVLTKLSSGDDDLGCDGSNELKNSYVEKITNPGYNTLFVYFSGEDGASAYVCFNPKSASFNEEAKDRCDSPNGLPSDIGAEATATICPTEEAAASDYLVCLP